MAIGDSMHEDLKQQIVEAMENMLSEVQEHNNDYQHYTPIEKVREWMNLVSEIEKSL